MVIFPVEVDELLEIIPMVVKAVPLVVIVIAIGTAPAYALEAAGSSAFTEFVP